MVGLERAEEAGKGTALLGTHRSASLVLHGSDSADSRAADLALQAAGAAIFRFSFESCIREVRLASRRADSRSPLLKPAA